MTAIIICIIYNVWQGVLNVKLIDSDAHAHLSNLSLTSEHWSRETS